MTGIERLRELVDSTSPVIALCGVTKSSYDRSHIEMAGARLRDFLTDIADQIERERAEDCYKMGLNHGTVSRVIADMERHVSGVEGMEDSPVARWARELREALGGNERVKRPAPGFQKSRKVATSLTSHSDASDVSMSAYDLLPQEDRDAIAWVREHGGLESVKAQRRESMPRAAYERKKAGFLDHIAECETALGRRREAISELNRRASDLTRENAELRKRAMPEGYEWPRYESGEPLRYEDRYVYDGREREVWHVDFDSYGEATILNKDGTRFHPDKGERVKRPAPKVLDADGVEIREKRDVWWICEGDERGVHAERLHVESIGDDGLVTCSPFNGGTWVELEPSDLYVNKPVPASDGRPLREGETVWDTKGNGPYTIEAIESDGVIRINGNDLDYFGADFVHERPDSWERLKDDATRPPRDYCGMLLNWAIVPDQDDAHYIEGMASDLVRRAKALEGVSE